ncbi:MAG: DUF2603 domain-containing protein [Wolinella sp.]
MARAKKRELELEILHKDIAGKVGEMIKDSQNRNQASLHFLDKKNATLEITKGRISLDEVSFIRSDSGDEYALLSNSALFSLLALIQNSYDERLRLYLEREILQQMPIDFDDVWEVAMMELRQGNDRLEPIDTKRLIKDIKRRHPNLFFQLGDLLGRKEEMFE